MCNRPTTSISNDFHVYCLLVAYSHLSFSTLMESVCCIYFGIYFVFVSVFFQLFSFSVFHFFVFHSIMLCVRFCFDLQQYFKLKTNTKIQITNHSVYKLESGLIGWAISSVQTKQQENKTETQKHTNSQGQTLLRVELWELWELWEQAVFLVYADRKNIEYELNVCSKCSVRSNEQNAYTHTQTYTHKQPANQPASQTLALIASLIICSVNRSSISSHCLIDTHTGTQMHS